MANNMNWRDVPSLAALRAFEAAARHGSFSGAARELNVTHAAVAQHVRALEDHFSTALMVREGRAMAPTQDGHQLAAALGDAFSIIRTASTDLLTRGTTRPLRIALTPNFAANWLMPRIGGFWQEHPDIGLELLPSNSLVDLRRDAIDVAIRFGRGPWPGAESEPILPGAHIAVASPEKYGHRAGEPLASFRGETWLVEPMHREEAIWLDEFGIDLSDETVVIQQSPELAREAAKVGIGIAILTGATVAQDLKTGALIELGRQQDETLAYHILTRPGTVSAQRNAFIRWLRKESKTD